MLTYASTYLLSKLVLDGNTVFKTGIQLYLTSLLHSKRKPEGQTVEPKLYI